MEPCPTIRKDVWGTRFFGPCQTAQRPPSTVADGLFEAIEHLIVALASCEVLAELDGQRGQLFGEPLQPCEQTLGW